ncbi:hypothetical protein [Leptolyngbya sp. FACHB-17]|uniref:hypothetical protein n=1 Tax=unclassified Leptolyngbya TaxID=2650499 RepID=UPI00168050DE|nr:hypothetical protein [Leptolyngbya sp. FACHB-17]MBD2082115.1 hypothetical protein [Leptolyngbya sp. FACHB-17]
MGFSGLTARSKAQDSPVLWLSFLAGSLVVHLAAILIGRWYFSQTASPPAGMAQAPLDFVEIDPNAPPLKQPQRTVPSSPQPQTQAKAAPPQTLPAEPAQPPNSIQSLARQSAPERSRDPLAPSSAPLNPSAGAPSRTRRAVKSSQSGQSPAERSTSGQNSTDSPRSTTNPNPTTNSGSGNSQSSTPSPGTSSPSTSPPASQPQTPDTTKPENPGGAATGNPTSPSGAGEPLSIATGIRGEVYGTLQEDTYRPEQYARGTVALKSAALPEIKVEFPSKLPVNALDLRLGLVINSEGQVVAADVREDSPTLKQNPNLNDPRVRADIQSIVNGLVLQANADGSLAFNVNLESKQVDAYRIMNIRLNINQ